MLKLYSGDSPNGLKVEITMREMELEHELVPVTVGSGTRSPEFLAINPNAKVPAVDDGGLLLWESGAILVHLAGKHGKLLPAEPSRRATALTFMFFEAANVGPTLGGSGIVGQLMRPEAERDTRRIAELQVEMSRLLEVLDLTLRDGREYLACEYSIADIQLFPGLSKALQFGIIEPSDRVRAWIERIAARPAVGRAIEVMPKAQRLARG